MSRAAKTTLLASILVSGVTVWGVHYMQEREREVMYRGVQRDEARQAEKKRQRQLDLEFNQRRELELKSLQPTAASPPPPPPSPSAASSLAQASSPP